MTRKSKTLLYCLLVSLLFFTAVYAEEARAQSENTTRLVDFLIRAVAGSHLTFIRNGENHTCDEAAEHIKRKYDYYRTQVRTPEDFIRLCASKSILSGRPYLVVTEQGKVPVTKWLEQILSDHLKHPIDS